MVDLQGILLLFVALFNVGLGLFLYLENRKSIVNISFAATVFFVAIWSFGIAMFRFSRTIEALDFWSSIYYVAAALIANSFLLFANVFPEEKKLSAIHKILIFLPILIVLSIMWGPFSFRGEFIINEFGNEVLLGPTYNIFALYFITVLGLAFWKLFRTFINSIGELRKQMTILLAGTLIAAILGAFFNLLLPWLGNYRLIWLGPYFTFIMIGTMFYAIAQYALFNIRLIATQALVIAVLSALLLQVAFSNSFFEAIIRTAFLLVVSYGGYLIIKSVREEIKRREEIQKLADELKTVNKKLELSFNFF